MQGAPAGQPMDQGKLMQLFEQFLQGMQAPTGPTPGSASAAAGQGMPKPMKQTGPGAPPTHAGNQSTEPAERAEKSLAGILGW